MTEPIRYFLFFSLYLFVMATIFIIIKKVSYWNDLISKQDKILDEMIGKDYISKASRYKHFL